ncbi:low-density lipoprotein receptor-related protein 3, partial [Tachysurus ichikawai]
ACGGQVELHTERRGVIYSPSWPLNYPAGVNCSWNIQGNHGEVITIRYKVRMLRLLKQSDDHFRFGIWDVIKHCRILL